MKWIASSFGGLYSGINCVLVVRDSENMGSTALLPPVLPHSLFKIQTAAVCELLRQYMRRLKQANWTQVQIKHVERVHRDLLSAYSAEPLLKNALEKCSKAAASRCDKGSARSLRDMFVTDDKDCTNWLYAAPMYRCINNNPATMNSNAGTMKYVRSVFRCNMKWLTFKPL